MHVSLTPELEELVRQKVATGRYNSSSELVREALRLWEAQEKIRELRLAELRRHVQAGIDPFDNAESADDEAVFQALERKRLLESARRMRQQAKQRGLTQDVLDDILNDD